MKCCTECCATNMLHSAMFLSILLLCCAFSTTMATNDTRAAEGRGFGVCGTSTGGAVGDCLGLVECLAGGGSVETGISCSNLLTVCCVMPRTCETKSSSQVTLWQSKYYPALFSLNEGCTLQIVPALNTCYLRVEFVDLTVQSALQDACQDNTLVIYNQAQGTSSTLCGAFTGYSTFIQVRQKFVIFTHPVIFAMRIRNTPYRFQVRITQLPCTGIQTFTTTTNRRRRDVGEAELAPRSLPGPNYRPSKEELEQFRQRAKASEPRDGRRSMDLPLSSSLTDAYMQALLRQNVLFDETNLSDNTLGTKTDSSAAADLDEAVLKMPDEGAGGAHDLFINSLNRLAALTDTDRRPHPKQRNTRPRVRYESLFRSANPATNIFGAYIQQRFTPAAATTPVTRVFGGGAIPDVATNIPFSGFMILKTDNDYYHGCGASLISHAWALTTARCVLRKGLSSQYDVRVIFGENELPADELMGTPAEVYASPLSREVDRVVFHPMVDHTTLRYDLALLHIAEPYTNLEPISLPVPGTTYEGMDGLLIGWGIDQEFVLQTSRRIVNIFPNAIAVTIPSNADCTNAWASVTSLSAYGTSIIQDEMVCAVSPADQGFCRGDEGGSLIVADANNNNEPVLVGVLSGAQYDCVGGSPEPIGTYPDIATRVSEFVDWINAVTTTYYFTCGFNFFSFSTTQCIL